MRIAVPNTQESQSRHHELEIENVRSGETIYQRCLLIKGRSTSYEQFNDYLVVTVTDGFGKISPAQSWPMSQGYFKALVLLSPGNNNVQLQRYHSAISEEAASLDLTYVPLLQTPPLHLAIMIAKDSPLVIDCPQYKAGGISSAHSSLDAAVAKFRTTAYMWQALTAEDMRMKGLGRRSFRIDEEYGLDTTSRASSNTIGQQNRSQNMNSVAKVHLVRSTKSTAQLRDPNVAQQNERGHRRDDLHKYFEQALQAHGGVFESSTRPIVAGMILDAHYSTEDELLLGHAALGCHKPDGLSLGVFGSHLTYSWPRFFEEIAASLIDTTPPGDMLCNDNGECETAWEACSIGQGAFLHEVGHAFGAPHTTGIMARGYAQDWPKNFLAQTAYCAKTKSDGTTVIDGQTHNDARWDSKDALSFRCLPHFRQPGDRLYGKEMRNEVPSIRPSFEDAEPESLLIECKAGIASIFFPNSDISGPPTQTLDLDESHIRAIFKVKDFDRSRPLAVHVLGQNGKERKLADAWRLLSKTNFIRIPASDIILHKRSVSGKDSSSEDESMIDDEDTHSWAVMLTEKGPSGKLSRANAIDLRVGCIFDGANVHFDDGHTTPCGPRYDERGHEHHFGGHASQEIEIAKGVDITKIEINPKGWGEGVMGGIRITLSNGRSAGELNADGEEEIVQILEPAKGEKIVGFYGQSQEGSGYCLEFGIITADEEVELPAQIYDVVELQNVQAR